MMQQIQIIEYDPKYSQQIYDFIMDIRINELGWKSAAPDLLDISNIYLLKDGNFWIALADKKVIGTIALENKGKRQGYLQRMYLAEKYRGTGLATELLTNLLKFAKSKNYEEIYLGTTSSRHTQRAIRFYEKSGFERIEHLPKNIEDYCDDVFFKMKI